MTEHLHELDRSERFARTQSDPVVCRVEKRPRIDGLNGRVHGVRGWLATITWTVTTVYDERPWWKRLFMIGTPRFETERFERQAWSEHGHAWRWVDRPGSPHVGIESCAGDVVRFMELRGLDTWTHPAWCEERMGEGLLAEGPYR